MAVLDLRTRVWLAVPGAFVAAALGGCGATATATATEADAGASGSVPDASRPVDATRDADSKTPARDAVVSLISDAGTSADATCDLGSAASFATQSSLSLFGQTVFFADGGALPPGHYKVHYVDGCMKYSYAGWNWNVNSEPQDAGPLSGGWFLVNAAGGPASAVIVKAPGLIEQYAAFTDCVAANLAQLTPVEFDYDGGPIGIWLRDNPYTDNVAGENGRNPKWSLTLSGKCPPPK